MTVIVKTSSNPSIKNNKSLMMMRMRAASLTRRRIVILRSQPEATMMTVKRRRATSRLKLRKSLASVGSMSVRKSSRDSARSEPTSTIVFRHRSSLTTPRAASPSLST